MTQRSSRGNIGPWRAVAAEAAATAAASGRTSSKSIGIANGGNTLDSNYSDESRLSGKNNSTLSSKIAIKSIPSSTSPQSAAVISTISNQKRSITNLSSSSMYHHHHDHHYSYNNTGYSTNGSISKSSMTAAAAAALEKSTGTNNGTVDTSDEEDDDYSSPVRRTSNYKNNLISASNGSKSKVNDEGPSSSSISATKLDRFGFYINDPQSKGLSDDMNNLSLIEITRKRESKWLHMFSHWDEYIHKKWKKLRTRCRKGIPDSVRGKAWFYLCAGHKQKQRNPELFAKLDGQPGDEKINDEIRKDLNRQFPSHEMFAQENGSGQEDLYRILKAFSVIKPDIGYCQGQAPLASVLLMQMPAEDAFWCLLQICDHYVPGYFSPGLEAIQLHGQMLSSFVKKFHPQIYKLFKKQSIDPVLYMTEWFMCFFSRTLSWPCVLRVWDMFFCEGIVVIFKVALILISSVLGRHEDRVKCVSAYETLFALKNIPSKYLTEEFLIERVINMDLSEKDLQKEHKEQSLKRKKEKERSTQQRSKSNLTKGPSVSSGTSILSPSSANKGSISRKSRSKSDFDSR